MEDLKIFDSAKLWRFWTYKAMLSFRLKYRSSFIGIMWPVISLIVVVAVIGTIWSVLLNKEEKVAYYFYLMAGYATWMTIASAVEQGCRQPEGKLFGGLPFLVVVFERAVSSLIPFCMVAPMVLSIFLYSGGFNLLNLGLILWVNLLLIVWIFGVISFLISLISVLPDLKHLIGAFMRLAFLATPIIWEVDRLGQYQKFIYLNPFYLPLESLRSVVLATPNQDAIIYFSAYSLLLILVGFCLLSTMMGRLSK